MSRIPTSSVDTASLVQAANDANSAAQNRGGQISDLDLDQFLQLMLAELQNQDPLNPMENAELLNQIGQMREIAANDTLTNTLQTVLDGQNLTTASSMIGKTISALDDQANAVEGVVSRVTMDTTEDQRTVRVHVGGSSVKLSNVREIISNS